MNIQQMLLRSLEESQAYLGKSIGELTEEELSWTPKAGSNSIIFIYWHLLRVEDMIINRILKGGEEIYESDGWQELLGTPVKENGFQYDEAKLKSWPVPEIETLKQYGAAVREKTKGYILALDDKELSREVRRSRSNTTVLGNLGHLITEIALHAGQIDYIRGMIKGLQPGLRIAQQYYS